MAVSIIQYAALLCGAASFSGYFLKGEHHLRIVIYIQILMSTVVVAAVALSHLLHIPIISATATVSGLAGCSLVGLYGTRSIYRLWLHPLRKSLGSTGVRFTSLWLSWQVRHSDTFRQLKRLHGEHGLFVRIGPNNLSISHPKAVHIIYGTSSRCTKSSWYDSTWPMVSLNTMRERKLHDERRRIWSTAFGDKALRGYEQRLCIYRNRLISHIVESNEEGVNVTKLFHLFSFDFMGDLAFGSPSVC
jgi:tryprostatin B 6-hydroxylase